MDQMQYPDWWIRGAGNPYPLDVPNHLMNDIEGISKAPHSSVLVIRESQHHLNLSGGKEVLVPSRLLYGLVPQALLDAYIFWQDESIVPVGTPEEDFATASKGYKKLRGYPVEKQGEYVMIVEIQSVGSWADYHSTDDSHFNHSNLLQCTGFPGRTVRIIRRPKQLVEEEFHRRQKLAAQLESLRLLVPPVTKKSSLEDSNSNDNLNAAEKLFKVDSPVECDYEGKGEHFPCVVRRVNDDGTYDLEYVGDYKWIGIQRNVDADLVQPRGDEDRKKRGEGIWHWEGMSESEDDDWRDATDDEDTEDTIEEKKLKNRITFYQFEELSLILEAASWNEDSCSEAIHRLATVPGVQPFTNVKKLSKAVAELVSSGSIEVVDTQRVKQVDRDDMILLNLLYAPRRSRLFSLMKVLTRIENVGHICAWTKASHPEVMISTLISKMLRYDFNICLHLFFMYYFRIKSKFPEGSNLDTHLLIWYSCLD